jgi:hypothetical protein
MMDGTCRNINTLPLGSECTLHEQCESTFCYECASGENCTAKCTEPGQLKIGDNCTSSTACVTGYCGNCANFEPCNKIKKVSGSQFFRYL